MWTDLELFINSAPRTLTRDRRAKAIARTHRQRDIFMTSRKYVEKRTDAEGRTIYMRPPTPVLEEAQVGRKKRERARTRVVVSPAGSTPISPSAGGGAEHQSKLPALVLRDDRQRGRAWLKWCTHLLHSADTSFFVVFVLVARRHSNSALCSTEQRRKRREKRSARNRSVSPRSGRGSGRRR